jgi:hypothetical protein
VGRDLGDGRGPAFALREVADGLRQRQLQLLEPARHPHRPALVTEVTLDLADDRGRRVGGELHAALEVEPVDRLDQADRGDLGQVVQPLAPVAEPPREVFHQRKVQLDQLAADAEPLLVVVAQRGEPLEQVSGPAPVGDGVLDLRGDGQAGVVRRASNPSVTVISMSSVTCALTLSVSRVSVSPVTRASRLSDLPEHDRDLVARPDPRVHAARERSEHRPGEGVAGRRAGVRGEGGHRDAHPVLAQGEVAFEVGTGAAWASSMPQASSTAMRRSSISSR